MKKQNKKFLSQKEKMIEYVDSIDRSINMAIYLAEENNFVKELDELKQLAVTYDKYRYEIKTATDFRVLNRIDKQLIKESETYQNKCNAAFKKLEELNDFSPPGLI